LTEKRRGNIESIWVGRGSKKNQSLEISMHVKGKGGGFPGEGGKVAVERGGAGTRVNVDHG